VRKTPEVRVFLTLVFLGQAVLPKTYLQLSKQHPDAVFIVRRLITFWRCAALDKYGSLLHVAVCG
jgi:hypothetical protein